MASFGLHWASISKNKVIFLALVEIAQGRVLKSMTNAHVN